MQETQETRVRSLSRGDPLESEMATHASIVAWRIPWTEEPGELQSMGSQRGGPSWLGTDFLLEPGVNSDLPCPCCVSSDR